MKRLTLFLLMVALISFLPCSSIAETLSLSTYYPAPFGVYNQLRLVPGVAPACNDNNDGLMWVDSTTFEIMMCRGSKAITTVGAWTQNTNTPPNIWSTDPTANVGIGLTEPKARLHIKGTGNENIFMAEVSGGKETISYDSSGILKLVGGGIWADEFWRKSDISLKENITPVSGLDTILRLEGIQFKWKKSGKTDIGLSAQNVEEVLPDLVATDPQTHMKSVKYGNLVAPLIEAIKEQQIQIEEMRIRHQLLRKEFEALKGDRL